jgi:hypothetical protein
MQWVTQQRPKIDRLASPWLISRFIDDEAEFLFVPGYDVRRVAREMGGIPFDVAGTELAAPRGGRSFDAFLGRYGLNDPALARIADIVRVADDDTGGYERMPEAAGLRAISLGLARSVRDDRERVAHGMVLYDALYRWAREIPAASVRPERGIALWLARHRERRDLAKLSPHMLRDIGLTSEDVRRETQWWFWQP